MTDKAPAKMDVKEKRRSKLSGLSPIWLVPMLALFSSLGLAAQHYLESDIQIVIEFPEASGIEAGATHLKYRDVVVGSVAAIEFPESLDHVNVVVEIRRDMAQYLDDEAAFWLVKAEVSADGVSGLDTLLSGAYIHGEWDSQIGTPKSRFIAEAKAPLISPDADGIEVVLTSTESGSVSVGAPVLHKGVKVGKVEDVSLSDEGGLVVITAFIEAPHDRIVNTGTRFWNASGIEVDLGEAGFKVHVESLSALLAGGVSFGTSISGGEPLYEKARFDLYPDEAAAKDSRFDDDLRATVTVASAFEGSLKGLREGALVDYRGLKVGEVKDLSVYDLTGDDETWLLVSYTIQPTRLGITGVENPDEVLDLLETYVQQGGLRARLKPNSLLSGGLHVELFEDPVLPPAVLERTGHPLPLLPAVPTPPDTLRVAAEGVMDRVAKLPVEELLDRVIQLVSHVDAIVAADETREIPGEVSALLTNVNAIAGAPAARDLPKQLDEAVKTVGSLLRSFEQSDGIDALIASLNNLRRLTGNVAAASDEVPGLISDIDDVVAKARDLPIETTVASVNSVLASAEHIISSDATQNVPRALSGALDQVRMTLSELRAGGAVNSLNRTLASAGNAADEIAKAATGLPKLAQDLDRLADTAEATIGAYGPSSPVNREVRAAIGDVRQTVHSLNALVQALRRNPNSILVGR